MTPDQCRAARGFLDLSQGDLAAAAHVSLSTVRDYEKGRRVPIANNLTAIEAALVALGISFSGDGTAQIVSFKPPKAGRHGPN
jgi:transcriptional regulator with XRE-family HTH domain